MNLMGEFICFEVFLIGGEEVECIITHREAMGKILAGQVKFEKKRESKDRKKKKSKDKMSRKEKKQAEKIRKAKIARGEAVSSDDEDWGED